MADEQDQVEQVPKLESPDLEEPIEEVEEVQEVDEVDEQQEEATPSDPKHVGDDVYKVKMGRKEREAPTEAPKRRARKTRSESRAQEDEQELEEVPEVDDEDEEVRRRRELEERLDAALKPANKRRKLAGDDLEALQDDRIAHVRKEMREAAFKDVESIRNGEPALNKIKMLPTVVSVLGKHSLADSILDGNLLESVRIWLEPLPDASLPSYEIQKELFGALERLPIKTIHLRESGLGRIVLFYQKSKRPHATIKRSAERLVGNWMRPIMGRSDDYRDKQVVTARYNPTSRPSSSGPKEARSLAEDMADRRNRAAIPTARGETYRVAPQNTYADSAAGMAKPSDSQLRRMKNKLAASTRTQKKGSKVSIEGRGLH